MALKDIREKKGMTQAELAERSGIKLRTIQHYEQGSMDINKAAALSVWTLSEALGVDVKDLLNI